MSVSRLSSEASEVCAVWCASIKYFSTAVVGSLRSIRSFFLESMLRCTEVVALNFTFAAASTLAGLCWQCIEILVLHWYMFAYRLLFFFFFSFFSSLRCNVLAVAAAAVVSKGHGQAVIDTHNWLLPAEENDENEMGWEVADAENEQKRILDGLIKVQAELDIAQPFSYLVDYEVAYPQYCVCVALPTCLENIICKMRNKFYRLASLLALAAIPFQFELVMIICC